MQSKIKYFIQTYAQHSFFRYLFIAAIIVVIELGAFQVLNATFSINYIVATLLSMAVGIVLNWIASRLFVFKSSRYTRKAEFGLVFAASLVGAAIQSATSFVCVELLSLTPFIGKVSAIGITFFWNYFIRKSFIFRQSTDS